MSKHEAIRALLRTEQKRRTANRELSEQSETDLALFARLAWPHVDPAPYVHNWHIDAICEHLEAVTRGQITRLLINIPPRCDKSTLVSVTWPAWTWAQGERGALSGPQVGFLAASYGHKLSLRDSVKCRRLIDSPWYKRQWAGRFALTSDQNTKERFDNDRRGYRLATSVGGALTGEGGDCFPDGTSISTPSGQRNIETILAGDSILAFDHSLGKVVGSQVVAVKSRIAEEFYEFHTAKGYRFRCTANHRIFSPGRGYIRAAELGVGERMLVKTRPLDIGAPSLRPLRRADQETSVCGAKGAPAGQSRFLLLAGMLMGAPCGKAQAAMPRMREPAPVPQSAILFASLSRSITATRKGAKAKGSEALQSMWGSLLRAHLLLKSMRERSTLRTDAWVAQLPIYGIGQVLQSIQGNGGTDPGTRRSPMFGMRHAGVLHRYWDTAPFRAPCSPPGREYPQQPAWKPACSLPVVSQETSPWDTDRIISASVHRGAPNRVHDIQVAGFSNFFADGVLAHNCILIDDPHNVVEIESETIREGVIDWWDQSMSTRLNDPKSGAMVIIMQRVHEGDLSGHVLSSGGWEHLMLPMRYDASRTFVTGLGFQDPRTEEGELLWPERFGEREVVGLEHSLGSYGTSGQLQQTPLPKGGGIFRREWWKPYPEGGEQFDSEGKPLKALSFPPLSYIVASVDTAFTTKAENDWSALTVWGSWTSQNDTPRLMLMDAWRVRLEFNALVEKIIETCRKRKVDRLLIEAKANGISVAQEIRRLCEREEFGVTLTDPKGQDKVARAYAVQHLWENGIIYAPDRRYADLVIDEMASFPKGRHDDLCLTADTMIATRSGHKRIADIHVGCEVLTPDGWRKVVAAGYTGIRPVINASGLTGTSNHPVFDNIRGYIPLAEVGAHPDLAKATLCGFLKMALLKSLNSTESSSAGWAASVDTIYRNRKTMLGDGVLRDCMSRFGNLMLEGRFLKAMKFIIKMAILSISSLKIWSAYRSAYTAAFLNAWIARKSVPIWTAYVALSTTGIGRQKAARGIAKMPSIPCIDLEIPPHSRKSSQQNASVHGAGAGFSPKATEYGNARSAAPERSVGIEGGNTSSAIPIMRPVFNLTVDGTHCYYANGILVHNCDTATQAARHLRDIGYGLTSEEAADEMARQMAPPKRKEPFYDV